MCLCLLVNVCLLVYDDERHINWLCSQEEIRDKISALETDMISGDEKSTSALFRVEKYREARRETERKLDTQYQRKM